MPTHQRALLVRREGGKATWEPFGHAMKDGEGGGGVLMEVEAEGALDGESEGVGGGEAEIEGAKPEGEC